MQFFSRLRIALPLAFVLSTSALGAVYQLDPAHSFLVFKVGHMGISKVVGRFNDISGTINLDDGNGALTGTRVEIKATSIDTGISRRDNHLRGTDFFDVARFPLMQFQSTSVRSLDDGRFELAGDLTLHGVTRPVTLIVAQVGSGTDGAGTLRIGAEGTFSIKRSDFGMTNLMGVAGDDIDLNIALEAARL